MRTPDSLLSLVDEGIIDDVLRPLMSGKEAQVYLVRSDSALRVAKVYKEAEHRSFKQRAEYTEGRNVRNSRDRRAINKRTRHGRDQDEAAWRSAEVDMIYRLRAAGVRVPVPYHFVDGVLIMELVADAEGNPAPRLGDLTLDRESATKVFDHVLAEVIRMLSAGVVHGDLSDFNVLMGTDGPVIIDFPQAVDASSNQNARKLLLRDVDNLHHFISRFIPGRQPPPFAEEMWQLYERGELTPEAKLDGRYRAPEKPATTGEVLSLIADAEHDERRRRESLGIRMPGGSSAAPDHPGTRARVQSNAEADARRHLQRNRHSHQPRDTQTNARSHPSSIGHTKAYKQPPRRQDVRPAPGRHPPQADAVQAGAPAPKRKRRRRRRRLVATTGPKAPRRSAAPVLEQRVIVDRDDRVVVASGRGRRLAWGLA